MDVRAYGHLHCVTGVDETLRTSHREQSVFFYAQVAESVKVASVPCEVRVSIAQPGHQSPTPAMYNADTGVVAQ